MEKNGLVALTDYSGKVNLSKQNDLSTTKMKTIKISINIGEQLFVSSKKVGSCAFNTQALAYSPNEQSAAIRSNKEYDEYTALNIRKKSYDSQYNVVREYNTRERNTRVGSSSTQVFSKCLKNKSRSAPFSQLKSFTSERKDLLGVWGRNIIYFYA